MGLLLVLAIAAVATCRAAPQFDNSESWGWGSTDFTLQGQRQTDYENLDTYAVPQQQIYPQYQRPNDYPLQDNRGPSNQCWDPVNQAYRDWPNGLNPATGYPSQIYNNDQFLGLNNRNPSRGQNPYSSNQFPSDRDQSRPSYGPPTRDGRSQDGHGWRSPPPPPHHGHGGPPPPHHHGHGGPPPPHHHGHGDPPPPHHHGHGGPPPPPPHHHGHEHRPPPPPPGYGHGRPPPPHDGYGHGIPPPTRRPPHNPQNVNDQELGICQDTMDQGTTRNPVEVTIPGSSEVPNTSVKPVGGSEGLGTGPTTDGSVKATTEYDWNSFPVEASVDNPGGAGVIDIRGDFTSHTSS